MYGTNYPQLKQSTRVTHGVEIETYPDIRSCMDYTEPPHSRYIAMKESLKVCTF